MNEAAETFNNQLRALCEQLRLQMKDATIVYVDIYAIKYDLIAHSSAYGELNWRFLRINYCCTTRNFLSSPNYELYVKFRAWKYNWAKI